MITTDIVSSSHMIIANYGLIFYVETYLYCLPYNYVSIRKI